MTIYTAPPNQIGLFLNNGDRLDVLNGGVATGTSLVGGDATIVVEAGGLVNIVSFLGGGTLVLDDPSELTGAIAVYTTGLIVFRNTVVTSATLHGSSLTLTYGDDQTAIYKFNGNTDVELVYANGTTELFLINERNGVAKGNPHLDGTHSPHGPPPDNPNNPPGPAGNPNHEISVIGIADAGHGHGHGHGLA